jgi:RimJ/RimL family protein N-acetyltransferase
VIAPSTLRAVLPCRPPGLATGDDPCATLWLDDGRRLSVAPLQAHDAAATQAFIAALSPDSRYRRFHVGIPMLPPALLSRLVDIDQVRHVALAARVPGRPAIVAEARYVVDEEAVGAEFAVTVADAWQGSGLGRQLLQRLARHARAQGLRHLQGDVLADNRAMRGLVERLGGRLQARADEPGVLQARFDAAAWSA